MRRLILLGSLTAILFGAVISWPRSMVEPTTRSSSCQLTALDVGQGDAILIRSSDGQDVLIDGGLNDRVIPALERNLPLGDDDVELVVATHPDGDHVGGLPAVLAKYRVLSILTTGVTAETNVDRRWREAADAEQATRLTARRGQELKLGQDLVLDILWPDSTWLDSPASKADGTNGTSIIIRATCGGSTLMTTGDAPSDIEQRLIDSGSVLTAAALKLGHHGSKYSTSSQWLQAVQPIIGVVSAGKDNRYGHPHPAVLERLRMKNITVRRTDVEGDVRLVSDGHGGWSDRK